MSTQQSLLDQLFTDSPVTKPLSGRELKSLGIDAALERAKRIKNEFVEKCIEAIKDFPSGAMITSEDVRDVVGPIPLELNHSAMAGILKHAAAMNLIVITNERVHAKRSSLHASELRVWRRL